MSELDKNLICIIGRQEEVWAFQGLGLAVSFVHEAKQAREKLEDALRNNYKFIFITDTYIEELLPLINGLTSSQEVSVTIIPGLSEKKNLGFQRLRKFSERGLGVDIVSSKL